MSIQKYVIALCVLFISFPSFAIEESNLRERTWSKDKDFCMSRYNSCINDKPFCTGRREGCPVFCAEWACAGTKPTP